MQISSIILIAAVSVGVADSALPQANFRFQNISGGVDAPVFDAQGSPLVGSNYLAELWGAATTDALAPAVNLDYGNRREIVPFRPAGYFVSTFGHLSIASVPPRGWAWLEVRAWDARLGGTYEEVVSRGMGGYGESPLFYAQGGDPFDILGLPAPLIGLQSFSLRPVVPEPSTWALLATGGIALWWARRRRRPR